MDEKHAVMKSIKIKIKGMKGILMKIVRMKTIQIKSIRMKSIRTKSTQIKGMKMENSTSDSRCIWSNVNQGYSKVPI